MPRITPADIIKINSNVPDYMKVYVTLKIDGKHIMASYTDFQGYKIQQDDEIRAKYYGKDSSNPSWYRSFGSIEPESKGVMERNVEPHFIQSSELPFYPWGYVAASQKKKYGECNGAWFIAASNTGKGCGPLLYDCILQKLGQHGYGLTSDRELVSSLAANVWIKYLETRVGKDVTEKPFNVITGDDQAQYEDDCRSEHSEDPTWNTWLKDKRKDQVFNAINRAYFDNGIKVLDELKSAGYLIEKVDIPITESIFAIYNQLLRSI